MPDAFDSFMTTMGAGESEQVQPQFVGRAFNFMRQNMPQGTVDAALQQASQGPDPVAADSFDRFLYGTGAAGQYNPERYDQMVRMDEARQQASRMDENTLSRVSRYVPGFRTGFAFGQNVRTANAQERIRAGQAEPDDYRLVAQHQRLREIEAERNSTLGGGLLETALRLPADLYEFGTAARFLGLGGATGGAAARQGLLAGIGRAAVSPAAYARTAALTLATPSFWAPQWVERNIEAGRSAMDWRGLPGALGAAAMQTAIINSMGRVADDIPGRSMGAVLRRVATAGTIGLGEQTAAEVASSAVGLETGYGLIGDLARGDTDAVTRRAVTGFLTFAAFRGLHEVHGRDPMQDRFLEATRALRRQGLGRRAAFERIDQIQREAQDILNEGLGRDVARAQFRDLPEAVRRYGESIVDQLHDIYQQDPQGPSPGLEGPQVPRPTEIIEQPPQGPQPGQEAMPERPSLREAFRQNDVLESESGGRRVELRYDERANAVKIDFEKPQGTMQGPSRTGVAEGTMRLKSDLVDLVNRIGSEGMGITFETNDKRAKLYNKALERAGFRMVSETPIEGRNASRYVYDPPGAPERPESRLEAMRRRQRGLGPVQTPEQVVPRPEAERLTKQEAAQERAARETRYEDIPKPLRDRVEAIGKEAEVGAERIRQTARGAYALGGEEGLKTLLEMQEARLKPREHTEESVRADQAELDQLTREFRDEVARAARAGRRNGLIQEAVQRRIAERIRQATQDAASVTQGERGPARPEGQAPEGRAEAPGTAGAAEPAPAPAPAGGRAPGRRVLSQAERDVYSEGQHLGFDEAHVRDVLSLERTAAEGRNTLYDQVRRGVMDANNMSPQKLGQWLKKNADKDATALRGLDEVPANLDGPQRALFESLRDSWGYHEPDAIWRILLEGKEDPHQNAIRRMRHMNEEAQQAAEITEADARTAQESNRQAGWKPFTDEELAAAQEQGRQEGLREGASGPPVLSPAERGELANEAARRSDANGDADFPFGANEPVNGITRRDAEERALNGSLGRFLREEHGYLDLDKIREITARAWQSVKNSFQRVRETFQSLAGHIAPRTTARSQAAGEAIARRVAANEYVERAIPEYIDRVLGDMPEAQRRTWGAAMMEQMRFRRRRAEAWIEADQLRREAQGQRDPEKRARLMEQWREADREARDVKSFVGTEVLPTEADYQGVLADPQYKAMLERWRTEFAPVMERFFRMAEGMEADEPINARSQTPGYPISVKAVREGEPFTPGTVGVRGSLKGQQAKKLGAAREFTGTADAYETDLAEIMAHTLRSRVPIARQAEMYRVLQSEGLLQWGRQGERRPGFTELPNVRPPKFTQEAKEGQTAAYVKDEAFPEVRRAVGEEAGLKAAKKLPGTDILTTASVTSLVEASTHTKNLLTALFKPGVSLVDMARNFWRTVTGNKAALQRMVDLAEMGATKPKGYESTANSGLLRRISESKWNPFSYVSRFLDTVDQTMRLTLDSAFDRLASKGLVENTETNRRNFINQLGQYHKRGQNSVVAWLRDTGIGPFATAGTNYTMQGIRALSADPGVTATSAKAAAILRAKTLMRMGALLAVVPAANYLLSGRADGDENTPLGGIRLGRTADGKTSYLDIAALTGIPRGARTLGLLALLEGARHGDRAGQIVDRARRDIVAGIAHPAEGPIVNALHILTTGENVIGQHVAAHAGRMESQTLANLQAALMNVNPLVASATGWNQSQRAHGENEPVPWDQRIASMFGPFGPRFRREQPPADVDEVRARLADLQEARTNALQRGRAFPDERQYQILHQFSQPITQLEQAIQGMQRRPRGPMLRGERPPEERVRELRQRQTELARRALEAIR